MAASVLSYAFEQVLRLLHPGMPFISEYLWQELQTVNGSTGWANAHLMLQQWPSVESALLAPGLASEMDNLQQIVSAIRNIRNSQGLSDGVGLSALLAPSTVEAADKLAMQKDFLCDRANLETLDIEANASRPATAVSEVIGDLTIHVPLAGVIDLSAYRGQLEKQLAAKEKAAAGKRGRLANPGYVNNAPADKVQETRDMLAADEAEIEKLKATIAEFST
jgi:valyl-tRNA synthetase